LCLSEALPTRLTAREKAGFEVKEDRLREMMVEWTAGPAGGSPFHKEGPLDTQDLN